MLTTNNKRILSLKEKHPHQKDIDKIVQSMAKRGFIFDDQDAYQIWSEFSSSFNPNWISVPDDEELVVALILNNTEVH